MKTNSTTAAPIETAAGPTRRTRACKIREIGKISQPAPRREFEFRGVTFFTRNLGATDPFSGRFVWFATDSWTHDKADGVFSDIIGAVADRFDLWEPLCLWAMEKFRTPEQIQAVREIEAEINAAIRKAGGAT